MAIPNKAMLIRVIIRNAEKRPMSDIVIILNTPASAGKPLAVVQLMAASVGVTSLP